MKMIVCGSKDNGFDRIAQKNGNTKVQWKLESHTRERQREQNSTLYFKNLHQMCSKSTFIQVLKRTDKGTNKYFNARTEQLALTSKNMPIY